MIATDLDGTILDRRRQIDPRDVAALTRARRAGLRVVAATSRPFSGAIGFVRSLELTDPMICYNGAQVRGLDGSFLLDRPLPARVAYQVIAEAARLGLHVHAFCDDRLLVQAGTVQSAHLRHADQVTSVVPDLAAALGDTVPKLVLVGAPEAIRAARPELAARLGGQGETAVSVPRPGELNLDVTAPGVNKRSALEFLLDRFGLTRDRLVAVGDSDTDVEMIEWAGLGVAVETGLPVARRAARRLIPGPGHGGFEKLVAELLGD